MVKNNPFKMKVCSKCGELMVASDKNFRPKKTNGVYRQLGYCRTCERAWGREYNKNRRPKRKMVEVTE